MSDTDRVMVGVRLETDDTLALADRVAGCLVLQYGQPGWRLVRLTTDETHPRNHRCLGARWSG